MRSRLRRPFTSASAPEKKKERNFLVSAFLGAIMLLVLNVVWPDLIPITSTQVWTMRGSAGDWLTLSWPIFAWGGGFTFIMGMFKQMSYKERQTHAGHAFLGGLVISAWAGVVEEVCFRWLIFLPAIATAMFWNYIFGGWSALILIGMLSLLLGASTKNGFLAFFLAFAVPGFIALVIGGLPPHIPEWFYLNLMGPFTDWVTFHSLHETLFHPAGFAVGAALVSTNAFFRDGHKYLGIVGVVNSWCLGMFFFYLMLNYGLPAAILVHFAYDAVVFSTAALVLAWRNDLPAFG
jgi:hypothetical protein